MQLQIHPVRLGFTTGYLIQGDGIIMIDAGEPNRVNAFSRTIERQSIKPEQIELIVITHGHFDHIGSAVEIRKRTGAKIVMHDRDKDFLEKSFQPTPKGVGVWGKMLSAVLTLMKPLVHVPPANADIIIGNDGMALDKYGIPGQILHTPGHTAGSISILLDSGDAFVGDLAMNRFPLRLTPGLPVLSDDIRCVKESWTILIDSGAETIYPSHGNPFSVDKIKKALADDQTSRRSDYRVPRPDRKLPEDAVGEAEVHHRNPVLHHSRKHR